MLAVHDPDYFNKEEASEIDDDFKKACIEGNRVRSSGNPLSLSNEHLKHANNAFNAMKMRNAILSVFVLHTPWPDLSTWRRLYIVRMKVREKILPYLKRVKQLVGTLKSMSFKVDGNQIAIAALNGQSSVFSSLLSLLMTTATITSSSH